MRKIVLAIATFLVASGTAFAGSDNFGSDYIPAPSGYPTSAHHSMASNGTTAVDPSGTKSTGTANSATGSNTARPAGYGQGIWGR